jgi:hypothetical protein
MKIDGNNISVSSYHMFHHSEILKLSLFHFKILENRSTFLKRSS